MAIINNIDFPEEVFNAISENKLVVFVGAGVSMGDPTNLPDFKNLTKRIAIGSGLEFQENENEDRFLGKLEYKGIKVHEKASGILSSLKLKPNNLHQYILQLFSSSNEIKIVTTNYDQMLEVSAKEIGFENVRVFDAPSLPLGDDVCGIIHIHGNTDDPKHMVLTDADFGKAYLLEGYTTRFLVSLFQTYTVLFIGYSYNDIVVRYLTRALPDYQGKKRYIMTSGINGQWETLGITPIYYRDKDFDQLYEGINKLGLRVKRGMFDWNARISNIASTNPPVDPEIVDEVLQALKNISTARFLIKYIHGEVWADWIDYHLALENLFCPNAELTEIDKIVEKWLITEFLEKNNELIFQLILKHKNKVNHLFILEIAKWIITLEKNIEKDEFCKWVSIVKENCNDTWIISQLVKVAANKKLYVTAWELFESLLQYKLFFKNDYISALYKEGKEKTESSTDVEFEFTTNSYFLSSCWKESLKANISKFAIVSLSTCTRILENLHYDYQRWGKHEPYSMHRKIINRIEKENEENQLDIITDIILEALEYLQDNDQSLCNSWINYNIRHNSSLLRRIAIVKLAQVPFISADEMLLKVKNEIGLFSFEEKVEIFTLVGSNFKKATSNTQKLIVKEIMEYIYNRTETKEQQRTQEYEKYNWLIWLNRNCENNSIIEDALNSIKKANPDFAPREHPELSMWMSSFSWKADQSPITEEELLKIDIQSDYVRLIEYEGNKWEGPNRDGLLQTIAKVCEKDCAWANRMMDCLIEHEDWSMDIWNYILRGLSKNTLSTIELRQLLKKISQQELFSAESLSISRWLYDLVWNQSSKAIIGENIEEIIKFSICLWNNRQSSSDLKNVSWPTKCLNDVNGLIALSWISLISNHVSGEDKHYIPGELADLFNEIISDDNPNDGEFRCVISGYMPFLYRLDKEWVENSIVPYFLAQEDEIFCQAWEGFLMFSRLNSSITEFMQPLYLKAISRIDCFSDKSRTAFISSYTVLMIYSVNWPIEDYIPKLFQYGNEADRDAFATTILNYLENMDSRQKGELWNRWLGEYWELRLLKCPTELYDSEIKYMLDWLLSLDDLYPDAVQLTIRERSVDLSQAIFLYRLNECKNIYNYPYETAQLLLYLVNCNMEHSFYKNDLKEIYNRLAIPNTNLKNELRDALLRIGIEVS